MALDQHKHEHSHENILRDIRPLWMRAADKLMEPGNSAVVLIMAAASIYLSPWGLAFADLITICGGFFFWWIMTRDRTIAFKMPATSKYKDKNNMGPGKNGRAEGILYLGNVEKTNEEVWFTNSDARTHILYLGTTGSGKTEGLKSMATNALGWGSGFVYIDGKADTDLWSSLSALVRRFGRDDDLLIMNYMTGNSDVKAPSNTMNPFSSGSASYLTNMLVSLMPESGGDNAMWQERAVSLVGAMMPALTWKRDNQDIPLSVRTIRDYLSMNNVIKLSRDSAIPSDIRAGLIGYLETLPGFIGDAFDDDGQQKPPGPDVPQYDSTTASQQHGYLAMQFTRSLQSLGDEYGYIFDTQAADIDMVDVVLNRRILIVLIPALEKSGDEIANLGKIIAATIKGMMGSTLGATVEGSSETVIENKPTHSSTPFMTIFDEVGYYTAQGMAVMAAQARSLGFCLVFSAQDLPAMKKRVREEANSIVANCNIKIFGKLEDPTETKEFFEKTVGTAFVTEVSGFQASGGEFSSYSDTKQASIQLRPRASYEGLRAFSEGEAVITFGEAVIDCKVFYSNPGHAKAMRVTRFMALPPPEENLSRHAGAITKLRDLMVHKTWTAMRADVAVETPPEITALHEGYHIAEKAKADKVRTGIAAVVHVHALENELGDAPAAPPPPPPAKPATEQPKSADDIIKAAENNAVDAPPKETKQETPPPPPTSVPDPIEAKPADPEKPPPPAAASTGPMGFFTGKKKEEDTAPETSSDTAPAPKTANEEAPLSSPPPLSSKTEPAQQTPAAPSTPPEEPPPTDTAIKKLPKEAEGIIKAAAKNAKDALYNKDSNET